MHDPDVSLIDEFCGRYGLVFAIKTDDITPVVIGLHEARVYCFDEAQGKLGVELCPDELDCWSNTRTKLLRAGFDLVRDTSLEAALAFESQDDRQCRLAVEAGGFMPVADSSAQRATMREVLRSARQRKAKQAAAREDTRQRKCAKLGIEYYDPEERSASLDWLHCGAARLSRPAASF